MPHESVEMGAVVAQPADACKPLENDVRGKAVLVRRGGCPFVQKAEQVSGLCLVFSRMQFGLFCAVPWHLFACAVKSGAVAALV
jgi:hypothetical protein